jgi:hypothetical protein
MTEGRRALVAFWAALACACAGEGPSTVPTEPLEVNGGQFIAGTMPGAAVSDGGTSATQLAVTEINLPIRPIGAGWANQAISGLVTSDAVSVGLEFADMGTGYWVVPVGASDPINAGQSSFGFSVNFNAGDPAGMHPLRLVAIGPTGKAGVQATGSICLESSVPDNLHSCLPSKAPPAAVISLSWDTNFDLDLHVVLPDGTDLGPQSASGTLSDAGTGPSFDRDSLAGCVPDGVRQEDLVFQTTPAPGSYEIRVDPFASCGQPDAHFTVTVYVAEPAAECAACRANPSAATCSSCELAAVFSQSGELLASQVTGGATPGLFVRNQTF